MPVGAVVGLSEIMKKVYSYPENSDSPRNPLSGTFNSLPISIVAGAATLDQLSPEIYEMIDRSSSELRKGFLKLAADLGIHAKAPGVGSVFQFYFTDKEITSAKLARAANGNLRRCLDIGLMNRGVYLAPSHFCCTSSATTRKDLVETLEAIESELSAGRSFYANQNTKM